MLLMVYKILEYPFDSDGKFIKHWESEGKDEDNLLRIMVLLLFQKVMSMQQIQEN